MDKSHLLLKNTIKSIERFPKRGMPPPEDKEEKKDNPDKYEHKKQQFRHSIDTFYLDINERIKNRKLNVPSHIDYVKFYFHDVFNKDLSNKFKNTYGLIPVKYEDFNKTVILAISDTDSFSLLLSHLELFINREKGDISLNQESFLLVHIDKFDLLSSNKIIKGYVAENILLELIDSSELFYEINAIIRELRNFLNNVKDNNKDFNYIISEHLSYVDIQNAPLGLIESIADNFDAICRIQSHTYKVGPNRYNAKLNTASFEVEARENATPIGIIDTGVQINSVLRNVIDNYKYDITNLENPYPIIDMEGHGTSIAGLAALGIDFFTKKERYISDAKIIPIKVLNEKEGVFSLSKLDGIIRDAAKKGIKLFNLSITSNCSKFYNESISEYAFLLDKLAYEFDVLFFISTGNLGHEDMIEIEKNHIDFHKYPNHFYNPFMESEEHVCECSNINPPAESFNNITIGAIAENFNKNNCHLTLDKELPAYYTKKYNVDYSLKVNGYHLSRSLINNNIFKPDIVFGGGDATNYQAGMEVLSTRTGELTELSYGTSNAAPLVANIAARIKNIYPKLNNQTVKALLINSSSFEYSSNLLSENIDSFKQSYIKNEMGYEDINDLNQSEKMLLSKLYNKDRLLKFLIGHGVPNIEKALYSDDNSVTLLIEDKVKFDSHKGLVFKLPKYLKDIIKNKKRSVLQVTATLCYKFDPIYNNSLAYCPLHISFAFFKPLDSSLEKSIDIIAGYTSHEKKNDRNKKILAELSKEKSIKSTIKWSEDYSPTETKPFSNTQKVKYPININDLDYIDNELNIIVRCTGKKNIDSAVLDRLKKNEHPFSLVIRIEEKAINDKLSNKLYNEIKNVNTVESILELENEIELNN